MNVFFYGLFMDKDLLAKKEVSPISATIGFVDGFKLRIGNRATLLRHFDNRVYGIMMDIAVNEVHKLYSDASVSDYVPQSVTVETSSGSKHDATCYNLPLEKVTGTNTEYARSLLTLATKLQLPHEYLAQIAQAGG